MTASVQELARNVSENSDSADEAQAKQTAKLRGLVGQFKI